MSSSDKSSQSSIKKFRSEHAVHYDLTVPRTAQDLGVEKGSTSAIFDRDPGEPLWDIQFILPGGTVVKTDGFAVAVAVDPAQAPLLNEIVINARAANLSELRTRLLHDAKTLGLPTDEIEGFVSGLEKHPLTQSNSDTNEVFTGHNFGYLRVEVDARARFRDEAIAINYILSWDAGATATDTPSPMGYTPPS